MVASSPTRASLAFLLAVLAVVGFVLAPAHAATVPVDDDANVTADGDGDGNVSVSAGDATVSADADASTDDGVTADASLTSGDASLECRVDDADCDVDGAGPGGVIDGADVDAPDGTPERPDVVGGPDAPSAIEPGVDRTDLPLGTLPADVYGGSVGTDDGPSADYEIQRLQVGEDEVWVVAGASATTTDDGPRAYGLGGARAGEAGIGHFGLASAAVGDERARVTSGSWAEPDERAGDGWVTVRNSSDGVTLSIDCDGERCQPRKDGVPGRGPPAVEYGEPPCEPWGPAYEEYPDGPPGPTEPVFDEVPGTVVSPWNPPRPLLGYCDVYNPNDPAFNATDPPAPGEQEVDHAPGERQVAEEGNVVWLVDTYSVDSGDEWPYAYGVSALRVTEDGRVGYFERVRFSDTEKNTGAESAAWTDPAGESGRATVTMTVVDRRGGANLDCDGETCELTFPGLPQDLNRQFEYGNDSSSSYPCSPWDRVYEAYPDRPPEGTEPVFDEVPGTVVSPWNPPRPLLGYCDVYNPNDPAFNATDPPAPGEQEVDHTGNRRQVAEDGNAVWLVDTYSVDSGDEWPYVYGISGLRATDDGRVGYYEQVTFSDTEKRSGVRSASWADPGRETGRATVTMTVVDRSGGANLDCDGETCELTFPGLPQDLNREFEYNNSSDDGGSGVAVSDVGGSAGAVGASNDASRSASGVPARRVATFPGFPSAFDVGLPGTGEAADALWQALEDAENAEN